MTYNKNLKSTLKSSIVPYTTLFRSFIPPVERDPAEFLVSLTRPHLRGMGPSALLKSKSVDECACAHQLLHVTKRSEEHTSELQSPVQIVCRLQLEKKNFG